MEEAAVDDRVPGAAARALVAGRWLIVVAWVAVAAAAVTQLPSLGAQSNAAITDIVPPGAPALQTEQRAIALFGAPAGSDVLVVQRRASGLRARDLARHAIAAQAALRNGRAPGAQLRGVVPLVNVLSAGWHEHNTTVVDGLMIDPSVGVGARTAIGRSYARAVGAPGSVTGSAPAQVAQFNEIEHVLPWITVATVLVVALFVSVYFRSLLAPLVTLATAGLAYVVAVRLLAWAGAHLGFSVPTEIEPLLVVLLLGLGTDYSVFFLAQGRRHARAGASPRDAAVRAIARVAPSVLAAGAVVAACSCALLVAQVKFFRTFGPGLAGCALVVTLVAVTLVPALMAILGPRLFRNDEAPAQERPPTPSVAGRVIASRPVAAVLVVLCLAGLGLAASQARPLRLGVSFIAGLPSGNAVHDAAGQASRGFTAGILAPTDIVLQGAGVGRRTAATERLRRAIARRPGVAATLGPGAQAPLNRVRGLPHLLASASGSAARIVVVFDSDPTSAPTLARFEALRRAVPRLARRAGLPATVHIAYAGESALGAETVDAVSTDFVRIAIVIAAITLVLLIVFLRALLAPVLLLGAGVLGYLAALGLTTLAVRALYGDDQMTYYVPLVGLVLLVALGSDYNVLVAGRIRGEASRRSPRDAVAVAVPEASRAITVAGVTLAGTFAMLAIVPLRSFRELALLLTIGVLLDTLIVRSVLVPGLISVSGEAAWWPGLRASPAPPPSVGVRAGHAEG